MILFGLSLLLIAFGAVIAFQAKRLEEEYDYSCALSEALEQAHREVLALRGKVETARKLQDLEIH